MVLAKKFKCPFCANNDAVECKMDQKNGVGSLACRLCGASYQMPIHHLHEPIDVFSEWLDDCEEATKQQNGGTNTNGDGGVSAAAAPHYHDEDDEDDDDDDDLPGPVDFSSKKRPAKDTGASNKKQKTSGEETSKQTFTDLGLDDSDSDSDDE